MTIEEQLTEIIKARYKSVMKFSEVIGVKYTTIKGMLSDRGILGASVQVVTKICNELGIEVEPLIDGVICKKQYSERLNLEELQYIKKYRALNEHGKKMVDYVLNEEYEQSKKPVHILQAIARGGKFIEKELTDEQVQEVNRLLEEIPPDYDENI